MRVVSLLPSATDILFAIGAGAEVVAVTHECDLPPGVELPRITCSNIDHSGSSAKEIDTHIVAARHSGSSIYSLDAGMLERLGPDLIITQELCDVCAVAYSEVTAAVRTLRQDVAVLSLEPHDLTGILQTITAAGRATHHEDGAQAVADSLRARIEAVRSLSPIPTRPRVVCVEWTDPLMVGGHWVPEMVQIAGGTDVLGQTGQPSRYVTAAEIAAADPDIIVAMPCGFTLSQSPELAAELWRRPELCPTPALRTDKLYAVDGSHYFNRPGPHVVTGLETLARLFRQLPSHDYVRVPMRSAAGS